MIYDFLHRSDWSQCVSVPVNNGGGYEEITQVVELGEYVIVLDLDIYFFRLMMMS